MTFNIYSPIFRKLLYPLYNKLIGRNTFEITNLRKQSQYLAGTDIRNIQFKKIKVVLINAYENIPFYQRRFNEIGFNPNTLTSLEEFNNLDFYITKDDIRDNTDEFISKKCNKKELNWHRTGGSTGTPLLFATDPLTDAASASAIIRALSWWNISIGDRHAMFWGSPTYIVRNSTDRVKILLGKIKDRLMNRLFISNYDLNDENMYEYYSKIEKFRPVYIRGMPSSLYLFAKFLLDNNLAFKNAKPVLIHSACEQLFDWQETTIQKAFDAPVVNTYGLSELGDVAYGAPCGNMHIMDEDVYVELIDFQGEGNEIVTTQLNNIMTPLIRYRTGDIAGSIDNNCTCQLNLRVLKDIKGRAHDLIVTPNRQYVHGQFFTHLLVFEPGVIKYQITQNSLDSLHIVMIINEKFDKLKTQSQLTTSINDYMGSEMNLSFEYVNIIPLTPSGKHRWIISNLDQKELP